MAFGSGTRACSSVPYNYNINGPCTAAHRPAAMAIASQLQLHASWQLALHSYQLKVQFKVSLNEFESAAIIFGPWKLSAGLLLMSLCLLERFPMCMAMIWWQGSVIVT